MNPTEANPATTLRVGLFTLLGIALIGVFTVVVNNRPYWWRSCEPIFINVEDATGLKKKSSIRSLGLEIGYLHSIELTETRVRLGVCITAPVEVLPSTRAYLRGEGFLGDKFVELKPVKYTGEVQVGPRVGMTPAPVESAEPLDSPTPDTESTPGVGTETSARSLPSSFARVAALALDAIFPSAQADDKAKEVPVGTNAHDMDKLMEQSNKLMNEMTDLTKNLKEGLHPKELRETVQSLNKTLQSASKTLSPDGGLNATARRSLERLEKAFTLLEQQMDRINKGEGSVGRLLNDPVYADEVLKAMKNVNQLLNKATDVEFRVRLGAQQLPTYDGGRGYFQFQIMPNPTRYYLLGVSMDPRGRRRLFHTTTTVGGKSVTTTTEQVEESGILLTGMLGKILWNRVDLAAGALHGDGAVSIGLYLGPKSYETMVVLKNDVYVRGQGIGVNDRLTLTLRPLAHTDLLSTIYFSGGIESFRKVNGKLPYVYGAGVTFTDDDIKLLFSLLL
jgi:phospholipid/cholesterol/gamma-HCH transport system substrate-binding protein